MNDVINMTTSNKSCLIIVCSTHHQNTVKVAEAMAEAINTSVIFVDDVQLDSLSRYELIGFGSGIDSGKHYQPLLNLVNQLIPTKDQKAFLFSTNSLQGEKKVMEDHRALHEKLINKGYLIVGEFSCLGFNTNIFLKYFGGINKNRPNANDLQNAKTFALNLITKL